jgi:hypothetical protein
VTPGGASIVPAPVSGQSATAAAITAPPNIAAAPSTGQGAGSASVNAPTSLAATPASGTSSVTARVSAAVSVSPAPVAGSGSAVVSIRTIASIQPQPAAASGGATARVNRPERIVAAWPIFFAMRPAGGLDGTTFKKAAEYVADGQARYVPEASDVAIPGNYVAVCEVVTPGGPITFPEEGWDVLIRPDVG